MHYITKAIPVTVAILAPLAVFAKTFKEFVSQNVLGFVNQIVIALIALAVFLLTFGIVRYISAGSDVARRSEGSKVILWGVISLVVMVSVWGLVNLLIQTIFPTGTTGGFELSDELYGGP